MDPSLFIIHDDMWAQLAPSFPALERELHFIEKRMETTQEKDEKFPTKKIKKYRMSLFQEVETRGITHKVIRTYHGCVPKVLEFMASKFPKVKVQMIDRRQPFPLARLDLMHGFRGSQKALIVQALIKNRSGLIGAPTRFGKCQSPDTEILMYNGDLKKARDIEVGDLVMGPDSQPRKVAAVCSGKDNMFQIIPNKGDPWECNSAHVLSLQCTGGAKFGGYKKGDIVDVPLMEYLVKAKYWKHCFKQYQTAVEFKDGPIPYDPYVVGVWLGDGTVGVPSITNQDLEVVEYFRTWATENGMRTRRSPSSDIAWFFPKVAAGRGGAKSLLGQIAADCYVDGQKRIPKEFLINSREKRLQLLAGLIDADGYLQSGKQYEIVSVYPSLAKDIVFLSRSLGFRTTSKPKKGTIKSRNFVGWYTRIIIGGPLEKIPCKIWRKRQIDRVDKFNPLTTGFTVKALGVGDYCGFELEGADAHYVLGNFTVTHNSTLLENIIRAFPGVCTVVAIPGKDLLDQTFDRLKKTLPGRHVVKIGGGSRTKYPSEDVTVCSMDSLHKCDPGRVRLLIVDEPHECVTEGRMEDMTRFSLARKYGLGATLDGRFDGRDVLISGVLGPVLVNKTYVEAVKEGAICAVKVIFIKIKFAHFSSSSRDLAYKRLLFENEGVADVVRFISNELIPPQWQTLMFISNEKQAELLLKSVGEEGTICMAKKFNSDKERKERFAQMQDASIKRCLCTSIYGQGVTFSNVLAMINLCGGGKNTGSIQKPGRLAEIRPGKRCGVVFDFMFECENPDGTVRAADSYSKWESWSFLVRDSKVRYELYKEKGYDTFIVDGPDELRALVEKEVF